MLNRNYLILRVFFTMIFSSSCLSDKKNNADSIIDKAEAELEELNDGVNNENSTEIKEDFKSNFAGTYTIEVKGVSSDQEVEVYDLDINGAAIWFWMENSGNGKAVIEDQKNGKWTADENGVTIKINGNSGIIAESYELKNGILTNTQLSKRYLKKSKE